MTKLGEKELKKWREDDIEMQKTEKRVEEQIRMLKKERLLSFTSTGCLKKSETAHHN